MAIFNSKECPHVENDSKKDITGVLLLGGGLFFLFTPTWGNDKWVETTKQIKKCSPPKGIDSNSEGIRIKSRLVKSLKKKHAPRIYSPKVNKKHVT